MKLPLLYLANYEPPVWVIVFTSRLLDQRDGGRAGAVKWRLTNANGVPVSKPTSFVELHTQSGSCTVGGPPDAIETYSGSSGLQYLGDGYWQFTWKTPKSYAGSWRTMFVKFDGCFQPPPVIFQFKQ